MWNRGLPGASLFQSLALRFCDGSTKPRLVRGVCDEARRERERERRRVSSRVLRADAHVVHLRGERQRQRRQVRERESERTRGRPQNAHERGARTPTGRRAWTLSGEATTRRVSRTRAARDEADVRPVAVLGEALERGGESRCVEGLGVACGEVEGERLDLRRV